MPWPSITKRAVSSPTRLRVRERDAMKGPRLVGENPLGDGAAPGRVRAARRASRPQPGSRPSSRRGRSPRPSSARRQRRSRGPRSPPADAPTRTDSLRLATGPAYDPPMCARPPTSLDSRSCADPKMGRRGRQPRLPLPPRPGWRMLSRSVPPRTPPAAPATASTTGKGGPSCARPCRSRVPVAPSRASCSRSDRASCAALSAAAGSRSRPRFSSRSTATAARAVCRAPVPL